MNLAAGTARYVRCLRAIGMAAVATVAAGCGRPALPDAEELAAFGRAGPIRPVVDVDRLVRARVPSGPYHLVGGDVISLRMPEVARAIRRETSRETDRIEPLARRVGEDGTIDLPAVGRLPVLGMTLGEVESAVTEAYHPRHLVHRPSVVAGVVEYRTAKVSIVGAVQRPGVYELRSDELSLVALLMKAEGLIRDKEARGGAGVIRIHPPGGGGQSRALALPMKGLNVPFVDVALTGGETVEVEWIDPRVFTVVGLVKKPGAYAYPVGVEYSLMEALAFAGGIDRTTEPGYVKVHRRAADGRMLSVAFRISGADAAGTCAMKVRPGDVVSVDHTSRTRLLSILSQYFRISTGLFLGARGDYRLDAAGTYE